MVSDQVGQAENPEGSAGLVLSGGSRAGVEFVGGGESIAAVDGLDVVVM